MSILLRNLFLLLLPQLFIFSIKGQEIVYGSNNGKYLEVSGRAVYYEEYGAGDTVLMLHGGPGSIADFSSIIPKLSENFKIIAIDSPGQGHSERAENLSYHLMADNASGFIEKMGIKKCHVIGWSDGACTGLLLAASRPDIITKVFVSGAFTALEGFTREAQEFWSTLTPEVVEKSWGGWHHEYQKQYPENDWQQLIYDLRDMINKKIYMTKDELASIRCKVLLAYGDKDMFTLDHIDYLFRTIPDSELMILPGTGHSTFDEEPEMMYLAIKKFFLEGM